MIVIEKFLGCRIEIPEDRRYSSGQGLWGRLDGGGIVFGLSHPALLLAGGIHDVEWLVDHEYPVTDGTSVAFAITGKILYVDAPIAGTVNFNEQAKNNPACITDDPYAEGWLFRIDPQEDAEKAYQTLDTATAYVESLKGSEGFKNPEGFKGGVSGICKAVYTGIGQQKL
jgi:glycine cleavage system H lipoate-binding protein